MPKKTTKITTAPLSVGSAIQKGVAAGRAVNKGAAILESSQNKSVVKLRENQKPLIDAVKGFKRNRRQKDF